MAERAVGAGVDWDVIAAEFGYPADWREVGYDTAETMLTVYERTPAGAMLCPWPGCKFARRATHIEAMFRHVHGAHRG